MKKRIMSAVLALALALTLVACGDKTDTEPIHLAGIFAVANNNPVIPESLPELEMLSDYPESTYTLILADGTPSVLVDGKINDFRSKHYPKATIERIIKSWRTKLNTTIKNAKPDSAQIDFAEALSMAGRVMTEGENNVLLVHFAGISTSGSINHVKVPIGMMDVARSVEKLTQSLPIDLKQAEVIWYGLASTSGNQPPLNAEEKKLLQTFYEELLLGLGAGSVTFDESLPLSETYHFPYDVSPMQCGGIISQLVPSDLTQCSQEEVSKALEEDKPLFLDQKALSFRPDSAQLDDEKAALEVLGDVIQALRDNPQCKLLVAGTTSSAGSPEQCQAFSEARAAAVCELLMSQGISADRLRAIGLGYSSIFYRNDRNPDGTLEPKAAESNRTALLLNLQSPTAQQLLGG